MTGSLRRREAEAAAHTVLSAYRNAVHEARHSVDRLTPRQLLAVLASQSAQSAPYVRVLDAPPSRHTRLPGMLARLRAGTMIDAVYARGGLTERRWREEAAPQAAPGLRVRVTDPLPVTAVISDAAAFVLPSDAPADSTSPCVAAVRAGPLHAALSELFTVVWRTAHPPAPEGAQRLEMLRLLAAGLPDHVISTRLGISPRTFYRRLRSTMEELGCTDRFQLGLRYHDLAPR